jgi:hypothetical protein
LPEQTSKKKVKGVKQDGKGCEFENFTSSERGKKYRHQLDAETKACLATQFSSSYPVYARGLGRSILRFFAHRKGHEKGPLQT